MNHLNRELAPITPGGWEQIEDEAQQTLKRMLAGRKLFDFEGPQGWEHSAVNLGRVQLLKETPVAGARVRQRISQPLIETCIPFEIKRDELEAAARGAPDIDVDPVTETAHQAAMLEEHALFNCSATAGSFA